MSRKEVVAVKCPQCGMDQQITMYRSINVTADPELKRALFEGHVNTFDCQACRAHVWMGRDSLLYHDMKKAIAVWYWPPTSLEDKDFLQQFKSDGKLKSPGIKLKSALKDVHIVFDWDEMLRYIVFRERLYKLYSKKL
jgi:hypothetical protein